MESENCGNLNRKLLLCVFAGAVAISLAACRESASGFSSVTVLDTLPADYKEDENTESSVESSTEDSAVSEEITGETEAKEPEHILVSFVGDLTLTQDVYAASSISFDNVVGDDYDYCFQNCKDVFLNDDLTLANLENAVTTRTQHATKEYVFGMDPEGLEMLTNAGIEAVNIANNHTRDYLEEGLEDTRNYLDEYGILWSDQYNTAIYETESGVKIGMFGLSNSSSASLGKDAIDSLKEEGANIIIASCHWGVEATYTPTQDQITLAHTLVDYGADIIIGTHPHRLQPIECYEGKFICYSLSNFCFGGNNALSDPDTAIVQCEFIMSEDGLSADSYKISVIPYSQTSTRPGNDFCPKPYVWASADYFRVLKRLAWSGEDE